MDQEEAIAALAALAQESRLDTYRALVAAGPAGLAAGEVAARLGLAANTLSFHLDRLRRAGLVSVERRGRSLVYAARFDTVGALIGYLTDSCCGGHPELCLPAGGAATEPTAKRTRCGPRSRKVAAGRKETIDA